MKIPCFDSKIDDEQALVAKLLATPEEKAYIQRAETRDRWRQEAGADSLPSSALSEYFLELIPDNL